jgi:transcription elongation GreA/GreB family factor
MHRRRVAKDAVMNSAIIDQTAFVTVPASGWRRPPTDAAALRRERDAHLDDYRRRRDRGADEASLAPLRAQIDRCDALLAAQKAAQQATPRRPGGGRAAVAGLGSAVTVRWDDGDEATYTIVGSLAVDPSTHRISYESPVGRALLGRRAAEWVEVATPARLQRLLVVGVTDQPPAMLTGEAEWPAAGR